MPPTKFDQYQVRIMTISFFLMPAFFGWWNWYRVSVELDVACRMLEIITDDYLKVTGPDWRKVQRACACANEQCAELASDN